MRGARWLVPLVIVASLLPAAAPSEAAPGHRIDVRERKDGTEELFDRRTGRRFVPRGAQLLVKGFEDGAVVDTLFGTQTYDPEFVEATFVDLESRGYNTVRVFLDLCASDCIADPAGGLREAYLANVADLMRIAKSHGLFVLLASVDLPNQGGYGETLPCCEPFGGYRNSAYLSGKGVKTLQRYWYDVVRGLLDAGTPMSHVLAFELVQEWFLLRDVPPLSLDSGTVKTADGRIYDLSSDAEKRRMVERNLAFLIRRVRAVIVETDPTALVTVGFFPPPGKAAIDAGSPFVIHTEKAIRRSAMDFVDLHAYPGFFGDLAFIAERFGVAKDTVKPMVMGEFGGLRFAYPSPLSAAEALATWQADSCAFGFDGWVLWLWAETDDEVWGGPEGGGEIADVLAPETRPKPCSAGGILVNHALGATATATSSLPDQRARRAVDGGIVTGWSAGAGPPQAIDLDLGALVDVARIELAVDQDPAGATVHGVFGRVSPSGPWTLLHEFSGQTAGGDWLVHAFGTPVAVQFVKVVTSVSPSDVAWLEIRVVGPP
jgi:F5/8 type C domain